ncbi:hypothetical protein [Derxia lacustris]|uniref:hypothetical protein n=1 Tax=Derxia lacustris TaxID=764842 RepID=UPI00111BDFD8|nr:hypothetical protein [Derxia lacustris]
MNSRIDMQQLHQSAIPFISHRPAFNRHWPGAIHFAQRNSVDAGAPAASRHAPQEKPAGTASGKRGKPPSQARCQFGSQPN